MFELNKMGTKERLTICAATWNMHGETPTAESVEIAFSDYKEKKYDMYVIGTQECLRSILISIVYSDKTEWESIFLDYINYKNDTEYYIAAKSTLSAMHIMVIAKKSLMHKIQFVGDGSVKTGAYGILGNKGAAYVWFKYNNIPITFINCHLAAFRDNQPKRNENYETITNEFTVSNLADMFGADAVNELMSSQNQSQNQSQDTANNFNPFGEIFSFFNQYLQPSVKGKNILNKFHFALFVGDYNSRSDAEMYQVEEMLNRNDIEGLLKYDQLSRAIQNGEIDINGFKEAPITFLPTYKYDPGHISTYVKDTDDHIPSFTDRIFYKIKQGSPITLETKSYKAKIESTISDHKPVIAEFELVF